MSADRKTLMLRIAGWSGGVVAALLLALGALLWTPPGHAALAWIVAKATDGQVIVAGIDGVLPGEILAQRVELRDADGTWLRITQARLDWSLLPALNNHIAIQQVAAEKIEVLRRPLPGKSSGGTTPRIDIDSLSFPHIDIAPSLIGYPAMLAAQGSLHYVSRHDLKADIAVTRPGGGDHYVVQGGIADDVVSGRADIRESPDGLMGKIAGLPGLGAIALSAQASGDRAANRMDFRLSAGPMRASGGGTIALAEARADLDFNASAPTMQLRDDIGWASLAADGHLHGAFAAPQVQAKIHVAQLKMAGLAIQDVQGDANGETGSVDVTATLSQLRLPGAYADLFAKAPVIAKLHADLADATHPVAFSIAHPLLALAGTAHAGGNQDAVVTVTVPSLAPFAALVKEDLRGAAKLQVKAGKRGETITLDMQGGMQAQGPSVVARMLGDASLSFHTAMTGADVTDANIRMHGAGFDSTVTGGFRNGRMDFHLSTALLDLSRLAPTLVGNANLAGTVSGIPREALIDLSGGADMASRGFAHQRIAITARATGLPPTTAHLTADGRLDGAALALAAKWVTAGQGHDATVSLDWKSLTVRAAVTVPQKGTPTGHAALDLASLADVGVFTGMQIGGSVHATGDLKMQAGRPLALVQLHGGDLAMAGAKIGAVTLEGSASDAFAAPVLKVTADIRQLAASGYAGDATARIEGPLARLALSLKADLKDAIGQPAHVATEAVANIPKKQVQVDTLDADWRGQSATLASPATIDLNNGIAVDHLLVKAAGGSIAASGRIAPALGLTVTADAIQLAALRSLMPSLEAEGSISAHAELHGTPTAPLGSIVVQGHGLRVRSYSSGLAPAELTVNAQLQGATADINAKLGAGTSAALTVQGTVPLSPAGAFNLHAAGTADLALLNPLMAVDGRQLKGTVTLDGTAAGTIAAPRLSGTAALKDGEFQDYVQGVRLHGLTADIRAEGNAIRIVSFTGQAGPGSIGGSGTIDMAAAGMPVDLTITARDARPIVSDRLTATLSGDLKLSGQLSNQMTLSGKLRVPRAELTLPDSFPPDVRTLNIRRRGQPPPPKPARATTIALNLSIDTTGPITVRGHGVDADLGGRLQLGGSTGAPQVSGGFEMARGTLNVAGQTLNFTTGKVSFDGTGVRNKLDPTLNFVAQSVSGGVTAVLTVTGYASAPKIALTSTPTLPQDEVLAHLLFQQSAKQLSPLQLAQIAQALASLSGIGSGFDPVASLRGGLGLDRLSVGGSTGVTNGATVEAGKYVARNVYVGAKQGLSGGTQAQVQVDITRRLKAQATISTGTSANATQGSTAAQDNGSNVGLSYQFEY